MNFKMILSGLMALMLGLGMSGCAVKQDDTVVEKAGKQTLNTLGDGVAVVGGVATAIASIPTGGLIIGLSSINTERLENITKEDLDSNENLEFLTKSGSVSIYSGNGFKRGHFIYFSECDNGKPIVYKGDWMVASRLMLQDAKSEGCENYIVYYNKTHEPSSFDEDKFYDSLREDKFGNKLWAGNDLILDIDNNKPSCIGCQEYIFRVKDARDTSDKAFYDYMDPLVYERLEDKYNDEVIYITEEALEKDDSYIPLIKSVNFSFYNKKGEPKDVYYVMDKRKGKSSLVKLDDDDFYEFIKEYNLEGVYAIPGYGVCQMDYSEFDSDKFEEEVIDNPDARYFYDNTVFLKKVSAGAFNSKYSFFFTYPVGYTFNKTDNPCTKLQEQFK